MAKTKARSYNHLGGLYVPTSLRCAVEPSTPPVVRASPTRGRVPVGDTHHAALEGRGVELRLEAHVDGRRSARPPQRTLLWPVVVPNRLAHRKYVSAVVI